MNLTRNATTATLALAGAAMWAFGATKLSAGSDFEFRENVLGVKSPNLLGLKESPYGQVVALGAQGEIDADWHGVETGGGERAEVCESCGQIHQPGAACAKSTTGVSGFLNQIDEALAERTNPNPASAGHKLYLRREIEDRLRLAFELDPTNYTNYNAYHFFLTEPELGTRPVLNGKVLQLAAYTARYCMREKSDPRAALTAASAAGNVLQLMFLYKEDYKLDQMREQLALMDQAIVRNQQLTERWIASGEMQNLSPQRQQEMIDRITYINRSREAAASTIERLSSSQAQASR